MTEHLHIGENGSILIHEHQCPADDARHQHWLDARDVQDDKLREIEASTYEHFDRKDMELENLTDRD